MKPLLIIKAGSKIPRLAHVPGDYEEWIAAGTGVARSRLRVAAVCAGEPLPPVEQVGAVIITGSAAMVTERAPWMLATETWLREALARSLPTLGICFGHQLLAQAMGGRVDYNPRGAEVGTVALRLTEAARDDALFGALPDKVPVHVTHRQTVLRLPPGAVLLAASEWDPHQAFRMARCAWGIQFHPEFERQTIACFLEHFRPLLTQEGQDPEALQSALRDTPQAHALLRRFVQECGME